LMCSAHFARQSPNAIALPDFAVFGCSALEGDSAFFPKAGGVLGQEQLAGTLAVQRLSAMAARLTDCPGFWHGGGEVKGVLCFHEGWTAALGLP